MHVPLYSSLMLQLRLEILQARTLGMGIYLYVANKMSVCIHVFCGGPMIIGREGIYKIAVDVQ